MFKIRIRSGGMEPQSGPLLASEVPVNTAVTNGRGSKSELLLLAAAIALAAVIGFLTSAYSQLNQYHL